MKAIGWVTRLTPFDRKLLFVVAIIVILSFALPLSQKRGSRVVVRADDRIIFVAPLEKAQLVELEGPLGTTILEIEDGGVRVVSSPCSQKVCIHMGEARHVGDLLACVPNQLVITIEGEGTGEDAEFDFISR